MRGRVYVNPLSRKVENAPTSVAQRLDKIAKDQDKFKKSLPKKKSEKTKVGRKIAKVLKTTKKIDQAIGDRMIGTVDSLALPESAKKAIKSGSSYSPYPYLGETTRGKRWEDFKNAIKSIPENIPRMIEGGKQGYKVYADIQAYTQQEAKRQRIDISTASYAQLNDAQASNQLVVRDDRSVRPVLQQAEQYATYIEEID